MKRPVHTLLAAVALGVLAVAALLGGRPSPAAGTDAAGGAGPAGRPRRVVYLSHVNDPATTPVFPGDPEFTLIRERRLGALGTDTFGPDPGTDTDFRETSLVLHGHRMTLENLAGLNRMPSTGALLVVAGPRNRAGSGAPSTILGLLP